MDPFDEFDSFLATRHTATKSETPEIFSSAADTLAELHTLAELDALTSGAPIATEAANNFVLLVDASAFGKPGQEKHSITGTTVEEVKASLGTNLGLAQDFVVQAYDADFDEYVNLNLLSQLSGGKGRVRLIRRVAVQATPAPDAANSVPVE